MHKISLEKPLTNLQFELLKLFAKELPEKNLLELKDLISDYMLDLARTEADKVWDKKGYTKKNINKWLNKTEE